MGLARLVVIEGPDLGCEFDVPLRGGGIGRGEGMAVQLSDLAVSRHHCSVEYSGGRFFLVDAGSRNRTVVNGEPITRHPLEQGDEIGLGKTRMAFIPAEGGLALMRQGMPSRVTMEVRSGELARAAAAAGARDQRAARHLASLAELGRALREHAGRAALYAAAAAATRDALAAERAYVMTREATGRVGPTASALADGADAQVQLPRDAVDKVMAHGVTLALDALPGGRVAMLAPLHGSGPQATPFGVLYADRREGAWDEVDLLALGCLAHLVSAAASGLDQREALERENQALEERAGGGDFIGGSPGARAVLAFVAKVGPSDATVLLTGESGSGKEMVARAVHRASRRSGEAFIAVNCAALTETLIESELFGHEKGAFTGATERKMGRFEAADRGTLFLDEVGELPLQCQTKFLRVLEEQSFERVGATRSIKVDVRVVAATNRDLQAMVARGAFREDLYYRLSVIHTEVPPLRARPADIPVLAEHFLARLRRQVARRVVGFTPEAMRALQGHAWPGNVRELRNAVERAIVLGEGELVRAGDLPPPMSSAVPAAPELPPPAAAPALSVSEVPAFPEPVAAVAPAPAAAARSLRDLERDGIVAALAATGGNKAQAAAILEIDRSTLYKKIKDYGIDA
ncbi:MAG TPA: sigma 54-interacting transcriptional regulator [Kofleriaceae bacterium]|nr:sigma 54-interacting transcriptional regulator [Kofleriaceae bacterium]